MTLSRFSSCSLSSAPTTRRSLWMLCAPEQSLIICHTICWNLSAAMFYTKEKKLVSVQAIRCCEGNNVPGVGMELHLMECHV